GLGARRTCARCSFGFSDMSFCHGTRARTRMMPGVASKRASSLNQPNNGERTDDVPGRRSERRLMRPGTRVGAEPLYQAHDCDHSRSKQYLSDLDTDVEEQ